MKFNARYCLALSLAGFALGLLSGSLSADDPDQTKTPKELPLRYLMKAGVYPDPESRSFLYGVDIENLKGTNASPVMRFPLLDGSSVDVAVVWHEHNNQLYVWPTFVNTTPENLKAFFPGNNESEIVYTHSKKVAIDAARRFQDSVLMIDIDYPEPDHLYTHHLYRTPHKKSPPAETYIYAPKVLATDVLINIALQSGLSLPTAAVLAIETDCLICKNSKEAFKRHKIFQQRLSNQIKEMRKSETLFFSITLLTKEEFNKASIRAKKLIQKKEGEFKKKCGWVNCRKAAMS
ncbi:hypothetical protein [Parendozoicomonas sp. Alg238-R29]|uniref:hypothetical protein n=1 Tax=Parendozoicomonas sp. Alg238-R29 TaxID=2993446 RepID=UPI00248EC724|nr:hypothetical protein [Parendozoicomonas sp. Alg238-R29]